MTPQELKNSILQLAIQGKLVEQRPEEGTGEELYKQIQAEKARLIKEGKFKKEKPLPPISEDEISFEIPEGWYLVRFSEISQLLDGEKKESVSLPTLDAKFLRGQSKAILMNSGRFVKKGSSIILVDGENSGEVFSSPCDGYLGSTFKELYYSSLMFKKYVLCFLLLHKADYKNSKRGAAIPHLNKALFFGMPITIPPLAEQKRIVAKIEELLPMVEQYEKAYNRLAQLNKQFPDDMKKSILQLAIQGKLVEQRPKEGTGEELYKEIQVEKARLIKEGKIKKEKPLPLISEDEIPFEIPGNWKWVRLNSIVYNHGQMEPNSLFSYIDIGSINNQCQCLCEKETIVRPENAPSRARKIIESGDIVYSTVRPYLHNMAIIDRSFSCQPIASTGFAVMACFKGILNRYLFFFLLSPVFDSYANDTENSKGVAYPAINDAKLYKAVIPLPPLAEQNRIVAKIEELLPLCDLLKDK